MGAPKTSDDSKLDSKKNETSTAVNKAFNADAIFTHLGFGWYQWKFVFWVGFGLLFPTSVMLSYTFIGFVPAHRCFVDGCDVANSSTNAKFVADWMDDHLQQNLKSDLPHWKCAFKDFETIPNVSVVPTCAIDYKANSPCNKWVYDTSVRENSITTDFDLVCGDLTKVVLGSMLTMVSLMIGAFVFGPFPDIIGRRKSVLLFVTVIGAFGIGSSFATSYELFMTLRFLTIFPGQAALLALYLWGVEAMSPNIRTRFFCGVFCCLTIGNLISGLYAYLIRGWRYMQIPIFVPLAITAVSFFFLPESVRWLVVKGKYEEAREGFEEAAKMNKKEIPAEWLIIPENEKEREAGGSPSNRKSALGTLWEILKTPCLLKRLLIMSSAWFAYLLCYYGLSYSASNLGSNVYLNYILVMFVEIPAYLTAMILVEKVGRRIIINSTLLIGGAFCLAAGLTSKEYRDAIIAFSLVGKYCVTMLSVVSQINTAEMFPTAARGQILGLCATIGKLGGIVSPFIANLGTSNSSLPYIIFGGVSIASGVLTLLLPETKGYEMPATVQDAIKLEETRINPLHIFRRKNKEASSTINTNL